MFLFIHLVLAHLIGDFPLQFDSVYTLKFKGARGLCVHVLIVTATLFFFSWPYLNRADMWGFLIFVAATHFLQDWAKIKWTCDAKYQLPFYLLDQALHIGFISLLFFTPLKNLSAPYESTFLVSLYNNPNAVLLTIALIAVTYNGHFMIMLYKSDVLNITRPVSNFEKWYGFCERAAIACLFIFKFYPSVIVLLVIIICAIRPLLVTYGKRPLDINDDFLSIKEIFFNIAIAATFGTLFSFII